MSVKDLLVHVDNSKACENRVQAAVDLATQHGAHLTGLYVVPELMIPVYAEVRIGPEVIEAQERAAKAQAEKAEKKFRGVAEKAGINAEWRCQQGSLVSMLSTHARYADILIIGQTDERDPYTIPDGVAAQVVLESGRPLLMIPYIGVKKPIGKNVMVAWNTSREAVRAVAEAMPLLEAAEQVYVMAVNPPNSGMGDIPCADISLHLARHGVKAEARSAPAKDVDVGNALLSRAADDDIDLLVMGAYGHSRLREMVVGGATRHLLKNMTIPVLLAH